MTDITRELAKEIFLANCRAVFAQALVSNLKQGITVHQIAERVQWTEDTFRQKMLAPPELSLGDIGVISEALDCELNFKLVPQNTPIAANSLSNPEETP